MLPSEVTGLVLAGGQGRRMGGVEKGLQACRGVPLARHAAARLASQVAAVAINANRCRDAYAAWGWPVWPDAIAGFAGPLAGLVTGCERAATPWIAAVACDVPNFPIDLVVRLAAAVAAEGAELAIAVDRSTGTPRPQPVFCLLPTCLAPALRAHVEGGGRAVEAWMRSRRCAEAGFDDASAFVNLNTQDDLQRLDRDTPA